MSPAPFVENSIWAPEPHEPSCQCDLCASERDPLGPLLLTVLAILAVIAGFVYVVTRA